MQTGRCYEMLFTTFGRTIRFRVVSIDALGNVIAKECNSNNVFEFNLYQQYERELNTLQEISCNEC